MSDAEDDYYGNGWNDYDGPRDAYLVNLPDTARKQARRGYNYVVQAANVQDLFDAVKAFEDGQVVAVEIDGLGTVHRNNIDELKERAMHEAQMDPEFLTAEAERMLARAQILRQVPQSDTFENGQVLYFEKSFGNQTYKYAAIKADDLWHVTGNKAPNGAHWNELVAFIGVMNLPSVTVLQTGLPLFEYVRGVQKVLEEKGTNE